MTGVGAAEGSTAGVGVTEGAVVGVGVGVGLSECVGVDVGVGVDADAAEDSCASRCLALLTT